jgi:hypothetical protein
MCDLPGFLYLVAGCQPWIFFVKREPHYALGLERWQLLRHARPTLRKIGGTLIEKMLQ